MKMNNIYNYLTSVLLCLIFSVTHGENTWIVTVSNGYSPMYIDGVQVTPLLNNTNNWLNVDKYPLDDYARLIAIRGNNVLGGCSGILGLVEGSSLGYRLVTDGQWRCSTLSPAGWMNLDFDDSSWPPAFEIGINGVVGGCSWIPLQDLPGDAVWIWTSAFIGGAIQVNCRRRLPVCDSPICLNGGTCQMNETNLCRCPVRYGGRFCEENINECDSNPCQNQAECVLTDFGYQCNCRQGFSGVHCETDITTCASNPCANGGTCVHDFETETYYCSCVPGYTGVHCETDIDECESEPCLNGATCEDGLNSVTCTCAPGFTGAFCQIQINYCLSEPCLHGSTCVPGVNMYTCVCHPGYTGSLCETIPDECEPNPCQNGGTCTLGTNGTVQCLCTEGWFGPFCDLVNDFCQSNPCRHGGTCVSGVNRYDCICDPAYSGVQCEFVNPHCGSIMNPAPYAPAAGYWALCEINPIEHAEYTNVICRDLLVDINHYNNATNILSMGGTFGCFVTKFPEEAARGACIQNYNQEARLSSCFSCSHLYVCIRVPNPPPV